MKINCTSPSHQDRTASMEVYHDGGYCYSCGWVDKSVQDREYTKTPPEDVSDTLVYIKGLPTKPIRGLDLPYDSKGYYIVWPDESYYKLRTWSGEPRYIAPKGHKPPPLMFKGSDKVLVLVEGEINALTLKECLYDCPWTIISVGSAGNVQNHIDIYLKFYTILAILDKDPAGVTAGLGLKSKLLNNNKRVELVCIEKDYNDILQQEGPEGVREAFANNLGLRTRM